MKPAPLPLRRYDLAFSLGYDCNTSLALRRSGLQFRSYPFDWLTKAPLAPRVDLLARRFEGWLDPGGLVDKGPAAFTRLVNRRRVVVDRATGLELRHDFSVEKSISEDWAEVSAKYARRAGRLLDEIGAADKVAAIFCVGFNFPNLPMSELVEARRKLAGVFGDKIDVIGIADDHPGDTIGRSPIVAEAEDGHVLRLSIPCLSNTVQGMEVDGRRLAACLRECLTVPDPRTPSEKRTYRALCRKRAYEKYAAKTWLEMVWNRLLFRSYRSLSKKLQRKGLLPPNGDTRTA